MNCMFCKCFQTGQKEIHFTKESVSPASAYVSYEIIYPTDNSLAGFPTVSGVYKHLPLFFRLGERPYALHLRPVMFNQIFIDKFRIIIVVHRPMSEDKNPVLSD